MTSGSPNIYIYIYARSACVPFIAVHLPVDFVFVACVIDGSTDCSLFLGSVHQKYSLYTCQCFLST
jgi:hypothetical protein